MSTGTMQRFMGGDGDDDLLPDFESDDEFDDYIFGRFISIFLLTIPCGSAFLLLNFVWL